MTPSEEPNDDDISDLVTTVPTIRNFREAVTSLEDVAAFLDYHGHTKEANNTGRLVDVVTTLCINSSKSQTSLDTFLAGSNLLWYLVFFSITVYTIIVVTVIIVLVFHYSLYKLSFWFSVNHIYSYIHYIFIDFSENL